MTPTTQIVLQTIIDMGLIVAVSVAICSIIATYRDWNMSTENNADVAKKIEHITALMKNSLGGTMVSEIEMQFIEMSQGGAGTIAEVGDIRERYYDGKPDTYFQEVCDHFGWNWVTPADQQH